MKKLLTILTLTTALTIGLMAQETTQPKQDFKPGFGPAFNAGNCHGGMGGWNKMNREGKDKFNRDGIGREHFGFRMMEELGLTSDQKEKIHQIRMKYEKNEIEQEAELKKLRIDKREAMRNMKYDDAKKVVKQMGEVKTKLQTSQIDEMSEITKVLNKEQQEKFKEFHNDHPGFGNKWKKMNK